MKIYVCSRGLSKGYCWVNCDSAKEEEPPYTYIGNFINLIDTNTFSVVIYRSPNEIFLLVTGLRSNRTDNRRRVIRNLVLWVCEDENKEDQLRAIAVQALNGELERRNGNLKKEELSAFEKNVDSAIKSYSSSKDNVGFEVQSESLKRISNLSDISYNKNSDISLSIGSLSSKEDCDRFIYELKNYSLPEQNNKILVLVSPTITKTKLENNVVWQGLSDQVEDTWELRESGYKQKKNTFFSWPNIPKWDKKQHLNDNNLTPDNNLKPIIILLLVVSLLGNAVLYFHNKSKIESLQSQIEQLKDKNQNLENQNQKLQDKNQNLENQNQKLQDKMNELRDTLQN